jgi:hypothetical protein
MATNALEALKSRDPETRPRLLGTSGELAEDILQSLCQRGSQARGHGCTRARREN